MIENKLLISFILGSVITGVYYYLYKDLEDDDDVEIGFYLTMFVFILITSYLIQIGYLSDKKSGGSIEVDTSGGQYKAPF